MLNPETPDTWEEVALCGQTDPELFFPEKGSSAVEAKRICARCDVRNECLEDALAKNENSGIRGGLTVRERNRLRDKSGQSPAEAHRQRKSHKRRAEIGAMVDQQIDIQSIADTFAISTRTVHRIAAAHRRDHEGDTCTTA